MGLVGQAAAPACSYLFFLCIRGASLLERSQRRMRLQGLLCISNSSPGFLKGNAFVRPQDLDRDPEAIYRRQGIA